RKPPTVLCSIVAGFVGRVNRKRNPALWRGVPLSIVKNLKLRIKNFGIAPGRDKFNRRVSGSAIFNFSFLITPSPATAPRLTPQPFFGILFVMLVWLNGRAAHL
ncbi:MAG: hypothetical protein LBT60_00305, partial [Oscillospiraceae bacterium]|nr:hypothetical protein [Oscillospiraceae bacterium]